jgi:hypothetical protein
VPTRSAVLPRHSVLILALLAGCQDYSFNPVQRCLVQPGATRIQLAATSSADILFVVDDSPSTDSKQAGLAASFGDFIARMVQTNTDRVANGLAPLDFHIAITTSSVFEANASGRYCQAASGGNQCCAIGACTDAPGCTPGTSAGCGGGLFCVVQDVIGAGGSFKTGEQKQCCNPSACVPASPDCHAGEACAAVRTTFPSALLGCTPGLAAPGAPYPAGAFVAAPGNPHVLDFDKTLDWASWGTAAPDPRLTALVQQFRDNVRVGSCGSGQEQHLQAGRLAMDLALAGNQPGVTAGTFPHPGAKLVVVWVGDEDDCSSPASAPLVFAESAPGADSCVWDKHRPAASQREYPIAEFASYFTGLVGAKGSAALATAFIDAGVTCADGSFSPADSCTGTASCPVAPAPACFPTQPVCGGAYAAGERFHALAQAFRADGVQVVESSVCNAYPPQTFGPTLAAIADLAKPPSALALATRPASTDVTVLRIVGADGKTRRVCQQGPDWCFVDCGDRSAAPACLGAGATSQCIAIAGGGACQANPGDVYSAEYLGMVPPGGCAAPADCSSALGDGTVWACYVAPGQDRGTCVCGG